MLTLNNFNLTIAGQNICQNFSCQFPLSACVAILGSNGIGKSTFLSAISGHPPSNSKFQGEIIWQNRNLDTISIKEMAKIRGYLAQNQNNQSYSSVLEYCLIGRHPHINSWQHESEIDLQIAEQALLQLNLYDKRHQPTANLSGGEQQRLAIATLLTQQPQNYLLDEPLLHLDLPNQIAILRLFANLAKTGHLVIMVLHEPSLARYFCSHCILLNEDGATFGTSEELLTQENLSKIYKYPIQKINLDEQIYFVPQLL